MRFYISIPLPFLLPFSNAERAVSETLYGSFQTTFYKQRKLILPEGESKRFTENTILDIEYAPHEGTTEEIPDEDKIRVFFLLTLRYVNQFIDAARFVLKRPQLHNISVFHLPPIMTVRLNDTSIAYITNPKAIKEAGLNIDESDKFNSIISTMSMWDRAPELAIIDNLFHAAQGSFFQEQFDLCIVQLETSFEVLLKNTLKIIWKIDGESEDKIAKIPEIRFKNLVEHHIARKLDSKIQLSSNTDNLILDWYQKVYLMRNKIVHEGYSISIGDAAHEAIVAYIKCRDLIGDIMVEKGYLQGHPATINLEIFENEQPTKHEIERFGRIALSEFGYLPP